MASLNVDVVNVGDKTLLEYDWRVDDVHKYSNHLAIR